MFKDSSAEIVCVPRTAFQIRTRTHGSPKQRGLSPKHTHFSGVPGLMQGKGQQDDEV